MIRLNGIGSCPRTRGRRAVERRERIPAQLQGDSVRLLPVKAELVGVQRVEVGDPQMADMVAAGMTPMQVIVAATRNSAEFLGMTDAGTLEAGKSADFIVLDANPLDDITNTRRISSVYLRGAAVDRTQPVR